MLELVWPWIFIVLPVPWLIRRYFKSNHSVQEAALRAPFINDLKSITTRRRSRHTSKKWLLALASLAWIFLIVSAARPQWIGEPIQQTLSQRDMIMAVDLSGSMEVKDFTLNDQWVDRLSATKWVAKRFIKRRHGDRIGLILFGDQAYLQAPLTNDRETVLKFFNEAVIGLAGEKTAIGDAIGLAVKRLQNNPSEQRVLILLTDGANTAGAVSPLKAAELASQYGVRIYTIGLGADELIVRDFFGARRVNPSADLDEKTLKTIADRTGGQYFRARDIEGFEKIYELIDQYEPVDQQAEFFRPRKELYYLPLACAVILGFSIGVIRLIRKQ